MMFSERSAMQHSAITVGSVLMRHLPVGWRSGVLLLAAAVSAPAAGAEVLIDFATQVRPLFEKHCFKCHGVEKQKGGLRLDNKQDAFSPTDSGDRAIVPHEPEKSLLIELVSAPDELDRMPQEADPLLHADVEILTRWIKEGASWPDTGETPDRVARKRDLTVTPNDRQHWAYRPLIRPSLPKVADPTWVRTPIDRFILARLDQARLRPAPPAAPAQLARRLSLTIT